MKRCLVLPVGALAITVFTALAARADSVFTFSSTPTITSASANPPGTTNTITNGIEIGGLPAATFTTQAASGSSTITLAGRDTLGPFDATLGVNTPFLDVTITSDDLVKRQYSLTFDVAYTLTDPTPGGGPGPQTVHFAGKLTGQIDGLTPTGTDLSFSVADFSPALGTGPIVTAGDGAFHITLDSFSNPGRGPDQAGGLTARVTAVPEPASILLGALGGLGLGILTLIHRKQMTAGSPV